MGANGLSILSRGFPVLCAAGLLLPVAFGQEVKANVSSVGPRVLFVCEHGAAKSVIAAAYFDKLARDQHLPHRAAFRGVNPDATLSAVAEKGLKQDGIDTSGWKPARLTQKDVDEASQIVTLGCLLPAGTHVASKVTDWSDIPSPSQNYSDARDQIKKQVRKLVDDLRNEERTEKKETRR